ncbi:MAG: DUF3568 family protein [Deltaproteobacteria bacterium]|nr:DUF3568 family protein [Deltaproteobacteria bacterium]
MLKMRYISLIAVVLFLTSCVPVVFFAGTVAGIGSYKYYQGVLTVVYEAPYIDTWEATLKAVDNLKMQIKKKEHDLTSAKIVAKQADNKTVTISLKYKSSEETEVNIRVGLLGNKGPSDIIKEEIRKILFE